MSMLQFRFKGINTKNPKNRAGPLTWSKMAVLAQLKLDSGGLMAKKQKFILTIPQEPVKLVFVCQEEPLPYWHTPRVHSKATGPRAPSPTTLNSQAILVHRLSSLNFGLWLFLSIPQGFSLVLASLPQSGSHKCFRLPQRPLTMPLSYLK